MKNVILDEAKDRIISTDDFKKYFNERRIISKEEYIEYVKTKSGKSREIIKTVGKLKSIFLQYQCVWCTRRDSNPRPSGS